MLLSMLFINYFLFIFEIVNYCCLMLKYFKPEIFYLSFLNQI
jgi:hypothetical protein